ncbi:MAG: DUF2062 domain-containing protein [Flavobacteriia bacterium]|nr:DUF2062 domain-containing protein [Flavobacteriia bacterium]
MEKLKVLFLIPTYNNQKTLKKVLEEVLFYAKGSEVVVVNDGSTDQSKEILFSFGTTITLLENEKNSGKGVALRNGITYAIKRGADYVISIDSDGQHFPSDIPLFLEEIVKNMGSMIMGSRNMKQEGVPGKSSFGNRFSNFWFYIETGISLPDTQTGFRAYPVQAMKKMRFFTKKFEFEIEIIVRLAWKKVPFKAIPIKVLYDEKERVSHFRPFKDFFRISVLNSILVFLALLWYYPLKLFSRNTFKTIKSEFYKKEESNLKKALSISFGVFMGIFPIWGFQLLIGIPLAVFFRLNKVLFIAAANISIPPMIPLILFVSYFFGSWFVSNPLDLMEMKFNSLESIHLHFVQYFIGAVLFSLFSFFIVFSISYFLLRLFRKKSDVRRGNFYS